MRQVVRLRDRAEAGQRAHVQQHREGRVRQAVRLHHLQEAARQEHRQERTFYYLLFGYTGGFILNFEINTYKINHSCTGDVNPFKGKHYLLNIGTRKALETKTYRQNKDD